MTQFDKQALNRLAKISDPALIFTALDLDDDGELDLEEFCDGIWQVAISKVPIEMQRMEKQVNEVHRAVRDLKPPVVRLTTELASLHCSQMRFRDEVCEAVHGLQKALGLEVESPKPR